MIALALLHVAFQVSAHLVAVQWPELPIAAVHLAAAAMFVHFPLIRPFADLWRYTEHIRNLSIAAILGTALSVAWVLYLKCVRKVPLRETAHPFETTQVLFSQGEAVPVSNFALKRRMNNRLGLFLILLYLPFRGIASITAYQRFETLKSISTEVWLRLETVHAADTGYLLIPDVLPGLVAGAQLAAIAVMQAGFVIHMKPALWVSRVAMGAAVGACFLMFLPIRGLQLVVGLLDPFVVYLAVAQSGGIVKAELSFGAALFLALCFWSWALTHAI